ncbi:MAG: YkgJ family cysteine cluster protein [Thermodesulfobacteriota bacterium]|nr:YkgJ family cysteine cluster protein [Thermodesulfobacteriota bacterium]
MYIETDIERVRELAEAKEDQNWRFRTFLKGVDLSVKELDSIAHRQYKDIARQIDCGTCANCCKEVSPKLSEEDVTRLASCLGISPSELTATHLRTNEDEDAYCFRQKPCPFLRNNRCTVYDARPDDCRSQGRVRFQTHPGGEQLLSLPDRLQRIRAAQRGTVAV